MVAPTATVELYVDGIRVPSTPAELAAGYVTALDNLRLTWGRDGQNEQPGPASTVFQLVDPAGRDDILDLVHVGSSVAVWAQGEVPAADDAGTPTFDPDQSTFDTWPDGPPPPNTMLTGGSVLVEDHTLALRTSGSTGAYLGAVQIPPRQFSPAGTLPNAWDDIPKFSGDDAWTWTVRVKAPAGTVTKFSPLRFHDPYASAVSDTSYQSFSPSALSGTGDWKTVDGKIRFKATGPDSFGWFGIRVTASTPAGRWQDQTATWAADTRTWADTDTAVFVDDVQAYAPPVTSRRVLVFSGAVSDLVVSPWGDRESVGATVTAMDVGADLGNRVIGDTPWPVQTVAVRADRVAQLAGIVAAPTQPRVRIDTPLDALQVSARDVDAQPAYALLQDLAQSAGGVLWAATHAVTGAFLWIENPANRAAVRKLTATGGGPVTITGATRDVGQLSACDLLEEPVMWAQDTADVVTVVAVTWAEQGPPGDDGLPTVTDRTVTVTDTAAVATYGTRRLSISTELVAESDATAYANRVLAQARAVAWRLNGLTLDTSLALPDQLASVDDATRENVLLDLLDGTTRMGAALTLVDLPAYAPRGAVSDVYVDGGTYAYVDGGWRLELGTTPAAGQGSSVTWAQMGTTQPTWTWAQFTGITWVDLYGTTV